MPSLAEQAQTIADLYQAPPTGRPSDIGSSSTVQQFLEAVGNGNYIETAAKLSGLSKVTVYEWLKRGREGEEPFASFANALEKAEARSEAHLVSLQRKAAESGPQYWPAAATQLERRYPDRWGKRQDDTQTPRVVVQIGVGQGEVKVGVQVSPPTFAPNSPLVDTANSLTGNAFALPSSLINSYSVNQPESVPTLSAAPIIEAQQAQAQVGSAISCSRTPKGAPAGGSVAARQRRLSRHKAVLARKEKRAKVAAKPAQEGA